MYYLGLHSAFSLAAMGDPLGIETLRELASAPGAYQHVSLQAASRLVGLGDSEIAVILQRAIAEERTTSFIATTLNAELPCDEVILLSIAGDVSAQARVSDALRQIRPPATPLDEDPEKMALAAALWTLAGPSDNPDYDMTTEALEYLLQTVPAPSLILQLPLRGRRGIRALETYASWASRQETAAPSAGEAKVVGIVLFTSLAAASAN